MSSGPSEAPGRAAVCFHGFLRTGLAMWPVRQRLTREGWRFAHLPTARYELSSIERLGEWAAGRIQAASEQAGGVAVDVVTHSMGGLVLRSSLRHSPPLRRVVMLSPPNQGAEMAAQMRGLLPLHRLGWDPLAPLVPGAPQSLPELPVGVEVGVLVGAKGGGSRGYNRRLSSDNDGKVCIDEARLPGAADFRVVRAHHTWIMAKKPVLDLVVRFLQTGSFGAPAPP